MASYRQPTAINLKQSQNYSLFKINVIYRERLTTEKSRSESICLKIFLKEKISNLWCQAGLLIFIFVLDMTIEGTFVRDLAII